MSISLDALNYDILLTIFIALSIPEILLLRQVSRQLYIVSEEHAVWKFACMNAILRNGIPFPKHPLTSYSAKDLKQQTLRAYKLGINWRSHKTTLYPVVLSPTRCGSIEEIKFLSRGGRTWIVTTSVSIWWTLCIRDCDSLQVVADWSPGKALCNGIAINTDDQSDAAIAISVHGANRTTIEILAIFEDEMGGIVVQPRRTLNMSSKPIALNGDVVALCDHDSQTLILNWKTQEQALLKSPNTWQDKPLRVVFVHGCVLVVRARSICVFEEPKMMLPGDDLDFVFPRVSQSFGWVDGVSLALRPPVPLCPASSFPILSLLVRSKGGDPWQPTEQFQFMILNVDLDPDSSDTFSIGEGPNSSPFNLVSTLSSPHRGPFRCSDMVLGPHGTAVWIQPSDWAAGGLVTDNNFVETMSSSASRETLVVALFPGLLSHGSLEARVKAVLENDGNGWSCLDYDEARGLVALGSSFGEVSVYRL